MPMINDQYRQTIRAIGEALGFAGCEPNETGHCYFVVDGMIDLVFCPYFHNAMAVLSPLGSYQPEQEFAILRELSAANYLWATTGGGTLSVDLQKREVYLGS